MGCIYDETDIADFFFNDMADGTMLNIRFSKIDYIVTLMVGLSCRRICVPKKLD